MRVEPPYNPLDKRNLGVSVADAMLQQPVVSLPPPERFIAAGIYAVYYVGAYQPYAPIAERNRNGQFGQPIYVGKAVPAGARKGGLGLDVPTGSVLYDRLAEHAKSIEQTENLDLSDFFSRYLAVDDIWIPLGFALGYPAQRSVVGRSAATKSTRRTGDTRPSTRVSCQRSAA